MDELEFVVGEILFGEVGALFEEDDGEAGFGELFGDDGAGGTGANDEEVWLAHLAASAS